MIWSVNGHSADTVVAIAQEFDPHTLKLLNKLRCMMIYHHLCISVKFTVELVQGSHQFFGAQLGSKDCEVNNISKEDAGKLR